MTEPNAAELVRQRLAEGVALAEQMLDEECVEAIAEAAETIAEAYRNGGKLLIFGNGGSAADAVHVAAEFVGRYLIDRRPLPAIALAENLSSVTAIGNDYGFEEVFARQVRALGEPGDVAIGLTTSGRSPNIVRGLEVAGEAGLVAVAMTGADPGPVGAAAGHLIAIPTADTPRVQEGQMLAAHTICEWVEARLAGEDAIRLSCPRLEPGRTAFLDRDGTINESPSGGDYIASPDDLRLLPGAAQAIRLLNEHPAKVIVVTNQRGIALGRMTEADLNAVHERLEDELARNGARLDGIVYCPHHEGECDCRKPGTGMFERAAREIAGVKIEGGAMIGDTARDMEASRRLGITTVRIGRAAEGDSVADCEAPDLLAAARWLIGT